MARRARHPLAALLLAAAATVFGFGVCAHVSAEEALEELRSDVRTSMPDEPDDHRPRDRDSESDEWDEDPFDDSFSLEGWLGLGAVIGLGVTSPFWGPPLLIDDSYMQPGYFSHYPYENGPAYMLIGPPEAAGVAGKRVPYAWTVRGHTEYGSDFQAVDWIGGHVLIDSTWRVGIESDFRNVREDISQSFQDSVWLGDANVLYRFAQSDWVQMRTGLGFNFLSDTDGSDLGFNFTYGGDWFPVKPLVLSAELDWGMLGSANVYHLRSTIGANWGVCEAYIGYDYYDIGPTQLGGLVAGMRVWY